jgi:hypothetical protein
MTQLRHTGPPVCGDPVSVPTEEALSDLVVFELSGLSRAERLWERLRPRWFGGVYQCGDEALVAIELRPQEDDLSTLLRAVQLWAADSGLPAVRFHLDGRGYLLRPASATRCAAAA